MKRSPLKPGKPMIRKTPLRSTKPMARGSSRMRAVKPKAEKPKRAAREQQDKHLADLCRNQTCYLQLPGLCCGGPTMPCHSNQGAHGKGGALKAHHRYTVPGCWMCHREIDQGARYSREEKFAFWDTAYARWLPVRERLLGVPIGN